MSPEMEAEEIASKKEWASAQNLRSDISYLSGWWARATPLKNMSSSIGMIRNPIFMGKLKMATKPPTIYTS